MTQVRRWASLLIFAVAGCVAPTSRSPASTRYICASGTNFTATFSPGEIVIRTTTGSYRLPRRDGSLERYGSESVAFVRDGTAGVLVGAGGEPFEACVDAGAEASAVWGA